MNAPERIEQRRRIYKSEGPQTLHFSSGHFARTSISGHDTVVLA
jgi:hypothetical protein